MIMAQGADSVQQQPERFSFTDRPVPLQRSDYDKALECYLARVSISNSDVVAVYRFGQIHYPGLSDLDLLVVLSDEATDRSSKLQLGDWMSPERLQVFAHNPLFLPVSMFRWLHWLSWLPDLQPVWGRTLHAKEMPERFQTARALHLAIEYAIRQSHWLAEFVIRRIIPLRQAIAALQSATYLVDLGYALGMDDNDLLELSNLRRQVTKLRDTWFLEQDGRNRDRVLRLVIMGYQIIRAFCTLLEREVLTRICVDDRLPHGGYLRHSHNNISFFQTGDNELTSRGGRLWRVAGRTVCNTYVSVPPGLFGYYQLLASHETHTQLGRLVRERLVFPYGTLTEDMITANEAVVEYFSKCMKMLDVQRDFLLQRGFGSGFLADCGVFDHVPIRGSRQRVRKLFSDAAAQLALRLDMLALHDNRTRS